MTQPLPTGWRSVTPVDPDFTTCAALLKGAHPECSAVSTSNLAALLKANYVEPLAPPTSPSTRLFYLYGYIPPGSAAGTLTSLVVAFYKTIQRSPSFIPTTSGSTVNRRWWCISVGVAPTPPAGSSYGWSYPQVKNICTWFYYSSFFNLSYNDLLVSVDDYSRVTDATGTRFNATKWEVDAITKLLASDKTIVQFNPLTGLVGPPDVEASYQPFTHSLPPAAGATPQLVFTGLKF